MNVLWIVGVIAWLSSASGAAHEESTCRRLMKDNGLTDRFSEVVSHGVHSLTLEDIRFHFNPTATEVNNIPTVNYNMSTGTSPVFPHAKLYGYDTSFKTISMRHLDQVLRDMDKENWYLTNYDILGKLVHTIHMNEMWAKAKVHYDSIALLGYNKELCACVKDVHGNGILQMLNLMALKIRYPGLTSGQHEQKGARVRRSSDDTKRGYTFVETKPNREQNKRVRRSVSPDDTKRGYTFVETKPNREQNKRVRRSVSSDDTKRGYTFVDTKPHREQNKRVRRNAGPPTGYIFIQTNRQRRSTEWAQKIDNFDFSGDAEEVKKRASEDLVDGDAGMAMLRGEKDWEMWKNGMKRMIPHDEYELAMFLYCVLN